MNPRLKIAVAEDEPRVRDYFQEILSFLGHEVVVAAADGADLVQKCRSIRPDLIISDLIMPTMDGIEAAAEICRDDPIPVIIVSAYFNSSIINRIVDNDIFGYLVKPIKQTDLVASIAVAMRLFDQIQAFRREVVDLERAIEDRKTIERAKGILMKKSELDEDSAYQRLRNFARDHNLKIIDIAQSILRAEEVFRL